MMSSVKGSRKGGVDAVEAVRGILAAATSCLQPTAPDTQAAQGTLAGLEGHRAILDMPRYEGHVTALRLAHACLGAGDVRGAVRNLNRVAKAFAPSSNDRPFPVGASVDVKRSRHGWHDGLLRAEVVSRDASANGTWSYRVRDARGEVYEVARTRDLQHAVGPAV